MASAPRPIAPGTFAPETALRLARHRALFANFFHRELFSRYLGSVTGIAWALVHPLALLAVYQFVFTTVFRTGPMDGKSFLVFVAVALWPWLAAQEALMRGTVSIAGYGNPRGNPARLNLLDALLLHAVAHEGKGGLPDRPAEFTDLRRNHEQQRQVGPDLPRILQIQRHVGIAPSDQRLGQGIRRRVNVAQQKVRQRLDSVARVVRRRRDRSRERIQPVHVRNRIEIVELVAPEMDFWGLEL